MVQIFDCHSLPDSVVRLAVGNYYGALLAADGQANVQAGQLIIVPRLWCRPTAGWRMPDGTWFLPEGGEWYDCVWLPTFIYIPGNDIPEEWPVLPYNEDIGSGGAGGNVPVEPIDSSLVADTVSIDPNIENSGLQDSLFEFIGDGEGAMNYDCRIVKCPKPEVILRSTSVIAKAAELQAAMRADPQGRERGCWLFQSPSGSIYCGEVFVGTTRRVPQMDAANAPPGAIGSIHSHWSDYEPPSPDDSAHAFQTGTYGIVATPGFLYMVDTVGHGVYKMTRPQW